MGPFGGVTQAACGVSDVAGSDVAVLVLVETAALAVAVAIVIVVLHAQESPIEETHREGWKGLKSFHQDIDRTGMTWRIQVTCNECDRWKAIYRAGSRRVICAASVEQWHEA